jgi:hypothetical protein
MYLALTLKVRCARTNGRVPHAITAGEHLCSSRGIRMGHPIVCSRGREGKTDQSGREILPVAEYCNLRYSYRNRR